MHSASFTSINSFEPIDWNIHYFVTRYKRGSYSSNVDIYHSSSVSHNPTYREVHSGGDNHICWRRLDDRLNTLYGSTYEVPLSNFNTFSDSIILWVYGDNHLQNACNRSFRQYIIPIEKQKVLPNRVTPEYYKYDLIEYGDISTDEGLLTIMDIVSASYPSSTVVTSGNFSTLTFEADDDNNLQRLYDDLYSSIGTANQPTHILFNGIERYVRSVGEISAKSKLHAILSLCLANDIRYVAVSDIFYSDYSLLSSLIPTNNYIDLADWFFERDTNPECRAGFSFSTDKEAFDYLTAGNFSTVYSDVVYNYICDTALDKLFIPVHRDKYYVSFVNHNISGGSYDSYANGGIDGKSVKFAKGYGADKSKYSDVKVVQEIPLIERWWLGKYGGLDSPNLFKDTGEFFAVIIHTGYSYKLWANQQFQANTCAEYTHQTGDSETINVLPFRKYLTGARLHEDGSVQGACYPCTGAPWFVMNSNNKSAYNISYPDGDSNVIIDYWLTFPDNYSCTMSLKVRSPRIETKLLNNWQSISFGKLSVTETQNYSFPLFCGGGSLGLVEDIYVYTPINGGPKRHYEGNTYTLDFNNFAMSNSNILHPTRLYGGTTSNFKVLSVEGEWKNIFAHEQPASVHRYPDPGPPPDYCIVLDPVVFRCTHKHNHLPNDHDTRWLTSTKKVNTFGYNSELSRDYLKSTNLISTNFIPVHVYLNPYNDHLESMSYGTILGAYALYDLDAPIGEYRAEDGKEYLIMPCGWEGRLYDYKFRHSVINDIWESDVVVKEYESFILTQTKNLINDRLVIRIK